MSPYIILDRDLALPCSGLLAAYASRPLQRVEKDQATAPPEPTSTRPEEPPLSRQHRRYLKRQAAKASP